MTRANLKQRSKAVTSGLMLVIDPSTGSTGNMGYAIFDEGYLIESGEIETHSKSSPTFKRIRDMAVLINEEFTDYYDMLLVEKLRTFKLADSLRAMTYVMQASVDTKNYSELTPATWQSIAREFIDWNPEKYKTDENDAVFLGIAAIMIANGWPESSQMRSKKGQNKVREIIEEVGPRYDWWGFKEAKKKWTSKNS